MIIFDNINKKYGNKNVISNLSYEFHNKRYCFFGKSGIGKTTIIRILMGLENIDSGSIVHKTCKKSVVFQENRLFENFTVIQNMICVNKNKNHCLDILNKMGLLCEQNSICASISGGMKRRLSIARALAFECDEYYFDEPFNGIDEYTKKYVIDAINEYTINKTCFFITHNKNDAINISDIILNINDSPINNFEILNK